MVRCSHWRSQPAGAPDALPRGPGPAPPLRAQRLNPPLPAHPENEAPPTRGFPAALPAHRGRRFRGPAPARPGPRPDADVSCCVSTRRWPQRVHCSGRRPRPVEAAGRGDAGNDLRRASERDGRCVAGRQPGRRLGRSQACSVPAAGPSPALPPLSAETAAPPGPARRRSRCASAAPGRPRGLGPARGGCSRRPGLLGPSCRGPSAGTARLCAARPPWAGSPSAGLRPLNYEAARGSASSAARARPPPDPVPAARS